VADADPGRAAQAAAAAGARFTTEPSELINSSEVDAVVIASDDSSHAGLILECFDAMTPVFCEKPLAPTVAECREVLEADADIVAATGISLLSLGFMRRFDPGYAELRRVTSAREHGEPLMVHCISRSPASAPGATTESAVTNSAIHELDAVPWLLGSPITDVAWNSGRRSSHAPAGLDDPALMMLRTADGTLTTLELFLNAEFGYSTKCEVVAEHGTSSLAEPALLSTSAAATQSTGYPEDWRGRFADAYRLQLQAWISALANGDEPPLATALDGLRAAEAAEAMIASFHNNGAYTKVARS
jgi:myo-inositol 2-dehydrogenase/D-chiro-inositol 1-dehydrogenase